MKLVIAAEVPDHLAKDWLQHVRDFDARHPGCHFEIAAASGMSVAETVEAMRVDPALNITVVRGRS
jgi:hypothetical protein